MRKVLVTGACGYIGSNLRKYLAGKSYDVYGLTSKSVQETKMYRVDLTDAEKLVEVFVSVRPDVVVHAAGLSSLSECERNPELAVRLNVETTKSIIAALSKMGHAVKLVFLSSDYVFDGERGNYAEGDEVNPQTVYGKTKVLSEADIKERLEDYVICRTANVYGRGGNFFGFVLDALERNKPVDVFDDVFFTPTYIDYLLDSLRALIELDFKGVIHVAGRERLSRYDFALQMAEVLGKDKALVRPVKQQAEGLIAKDSSLNCEFSRKLLRNYWLNVEESLHYCFGNLVAPYFYFVDERGKLVGLFQGQRWEEVNYVESAKGCVRGNHYHKETTEGFFVIDGKIKVTLVGITKDFERTFVAKKGDIMVINPNTIHSFEMIKDSKWINMLSKPLGDNAKDIHNLAQS
jgi:dTDP-4-dehydrorhamnose reductase